MPFGFEGFDLFGLFDVTESALYVIVPVISSGDSRFNSSQHQKIIPYGIHLPLNLALCLARLMA